MNKWKIAFWCCLILLFLVSVFSVYLIIDQAYTLTYRKVSYEDTDKDLDQLIKIINNTDLTKKQIVTELKGDNQFESVNFKSDTISLNQVLIIFENDKIRKITKHY